VRFYIAVAHPERIHRNNLIVEKRNPFFVLGDYAYLKYS